MADSADRTSCPARASGWLSGRTTSGTRSASRGALLAELDAVEPGYPETMLEREQSVSTFIGEGVAIPHGTDASRALVRRTTLGVLQFPDGVDWDGQRVTICVAIAAKGDEHVTVLSALAQILHGPRPGASAAHVGERRRGRTNCCRINRGRDLQA